MSQPLLVLMASGQWVEGCDSSSVCLSASSDPEAGAGNLLWLLCIVNSLPAPVLNRLWGWEVWRSMAEREAIPPVLISPLLGSPNFQQTDSHLDFETNIPLKFPLTVG